MAEAFYSSAGIQQWLPPDFPFFTARELSFPAINTE
jgi:hypothetical protein